ncbi:MAG: DUF4386 domain-containing protein [Phycisphaerales bacterium]|nr:MAG: DUF4386 domain-containing protein [Phycisphaerales bacterium]
MNTDKRAARIVGILFIIGTAAGILSLVTGASLLDDADYLLKIPENEEQMLLGAFSVLVMGLALAMIPVVMFPIFRKYNETLAVGYVVFRGALEAVSYILIVLSWLMLITLSKEYVNAGAPDASSFQTWGALLKEVGEWIDPILGIAFCLGALMFYYLWFTSRLIPRWLSGWGLIGAAISLTAALINMFGPSAEFLELPLAVNEMVLALWLIVKGFDSSALASGSARA